MKDFSGVFTALITPFKRGAIDWPSLRRLLRAQLDSGIQGFVICGTTGESPTLDSGEKEELFKFVHSEVSGQVPLVMGTGSNCTSETVAATKRAATLCADAALVVVPYYNKPPQRGLFQHFQKVAESSSIPIILYNVPGRTVARLDLETVVELSQLENVIGIKEATGDIEFGREIVAGSHEKFFVTSGDDGTFLDLIPVGATGVISVASHVFPKQFVDWCQRARQGDGSARSEFARIADLNSCFYVEANPIPIKMALFAMGLIESPELRLPLVSMSEPLAAELKKKMKAAGLI